MQPQLLSQSEYAGLAHSLGLTAHQCAQCGALVCISSARDRKVLCGRFTCRAGLWSMREAASQARERQGWSDYAVEVPPPQRSLVA